MSQPGHSAADRSAVCLGDKSKDQPLSQRKARKSPKQLQTCMLMRLQQRYALSWGVTDTLPSVLHKHKQHQNLL